MDSSQGFTYGMKRNARSAPMPFKMDRKGLKFFSQNACRRSHGVVSLIGDLQCYNIVAAAGIGILDLPFEFVAHEGIEALSPSGRLERSRTEKDWTWWWTIPHAGRPAQAMTPQAVCEKPADHGFRVWRARDRATIRHGAVLP